MHKELIDYIGRIEKKIEDSVKLFCSSPTKLGLSLVP